MPKKPKAAAELPELDVIRRLQRGRRDIDRRLLRPVTTWLVMIALRHQRAADAVRDANPNPNDYQTSAYRVHNLTTVKIIEYLASILPDGFGFKEWADAEAYIAASLAGGVAPPLPTDPQMIPVPTPKG